MMNRCYTILMGKIVISKLRCRRCSHEWVPRGDMVTICPKCKSPYWDRDKVRK